MIANFYMNDGYVGGFYVDALPRKGDFVKLPSGPGHLTVEVLAVVHMPSEFKGSQVTRVIVKGVKNEQEG